MPFRARPHFSPPLTSLTLFLLFFFGIAIFRVTSQSASSYLSDYGAAWSNPASLGDFGFRQNPSYEERYIHHMMNLVRMSPTDARTFGYCGVSTNLILPDRYPPVDPIWFHPLLTEAARFHCMDLSENRCGLQHNSCDGTGMGTRVTRFLECGSKSENGASGYGYSNVNDGWLSDGGAPDGSGDPHRRTIMSASKTMVGNGEYYGYIFGDFSNCDSIFGRDTHPVYSAIHRFVGGNLKLMVVFSMHSISPNDVTHAWVRLDGEKYPLTLEFGEANHGHYVFEIEKLSSTSGVDEPEPCRKYYFQFEVAGHDSPFQYPMKGSLLSVGEGSSPLDMFATDSWSPEAAIAENVAVAKGLTAGLTGFATLGLGIILVVVLMLTVFSTAACNCICCGKGEKKKKNTGSDV